MNEFRLTRKRKTKKPCSECFLHISRCICTQIPTLELRTKISLLVHHRELKRTTNTGRLALKALLNSEMIVRGQKDSLADLTPILTSDYENLLFFPSPQAVELNQNLISQYNRPIRLIVPDGNWRQAAKVASRHPELASIPHVKIGEKNTSTSHLRREHLAEGMSTLEAIAKALRVLEGEDVYKSLNELYRAKLNATLLGRGESVHIPTQLRT